ncbi:MAG: hypothetical protein ACI9G1_004397 [Pirellulaceae bacterium]
MNPSSNTGKSSTSGVKSPASVGALRELAVSFAASGVNEPIEGADELSVGFSTLGCGCQAAVDEGGGSEGDS